jgi:hypothetical protein
MRLNLAHGLAAVRGLQHGHVLSQLSEHRKKLADQNVIIDQKDLHLRTLLHHLRRNSQSGVGNHQRAGRSPPLAISHYAHAREPSSI